MTFDISIGALILAGGVALGYLIRQLLATRNLNSIEATIKRQLEESKTQAKEALLENVFLTGPFSVAKTAQIKNSKF